MKSKNHIKAKNESLRGIGKLGWTESGILHTTMKKLSATFDNEESVTPAKGFKKPKLKCPHCKRRFVGKIPAKHKNYWGYEICKPHPFHPSIEKELSETEINGLKIIPGDKVAFIPYPFHNFFNCGERDMLERQVKKIYRMTDSSIHVKFDVEDQTFRLAFFNSSKNFIKI